MTIEYYTAQMEKIRMIGFSHSKREELQMSLNKLAIALGDEEMILYLSDIIRKIAIDSENGTDNTIKGVDGVTLVNPVASLLEGGFQINSKYLNSLFRIKTQVLGGVPVYGVFIPYS